MSLTLRSSLILGAAAALLAACNSPEDEASPPPVEAPEPVLTQAPLVTQAPDGTKVAEGSWEVNEAASGAQAVFTGQDGVELVGLRCDVASGAVTMNIAADDGVPTSYRIDAGGEAARVDLVPANGGLVAEIEPSLAIFYAFAQEGQVIALTSPAGMKTQYPTHPGIDRVLDACS